MGSDRLMGSDRSVERTRCSWMVYFLLLFVDLVCLLVWSERKEFDGEPKDGKILCSGIKYGGIG